MATVTRDDAGDDGCGSNHRNCSRDDLLAIRSKATISSKTGDTEDWIKIELDRGHDSIKINLSGA